MTTPYYSDESVTLFHGDCIKIMTELPDASIDAIVTDPPYGLGFMGKEWDDLPPGEDWARECLRVLKPGGHLLAFGGSRTWHRLAIAVEDAGFEIRDSIAWLYSQGFPKSLDVDKAIGKAAAVHPSELACERCGRTTYYCECWKGWGTALKPAFEPIVVGRKPLDGTVASNVLQYGTGGLNVGATRTAHVSESDRAESEAKNRHADFGSGPRENQVSGDDKRKRGEGGNYDGAQGRWPTNVVLDESQANALDEQTGPLRGAGNKNPIRRQTKGGYGGGWGAGEFGLHPAMADGDSTASSRFFPTFRYQAKAGDSERIRDGEVAHPTVKPLELMRWLVRLVTPVRGKVLDTFGGSGTTAEACILEGFQCIIIEREAIYLPLIVARITKPIQVGLDFGGVA